MRTWVVAFTVLVSSAALSSVCLARDRHLRPAGKDTVIGAVGKNHVVLTKSYYRRITDDRGFPHVQAIPAGIYRVQFEDDEGYYLPAPSFMTVVVGDSLHRTWEEKIGLFVPKKRPELVRLYRLHPQTNQPLPPDALEPPLGARFAALLRQ